MPVALAALAFALGCLMRAPGLSSSFLQGDEFHTLGLASQGYAVIAGSYEPKTGSLALPLLQRAALDAVGWTVGAGRLPALLGGLLGLAAMYPVARRFVGAPAAAIAMLALSANPRHVFYSHFARAYSLVVFGALVFAYALRRVTEPGESSRGGYALVAGSAALLPFTHLTALALVASAGAGAGAIFLLQKRPRADWLWLGGSFAMAGLLCLALHLPAWDPFLAFLRSRSALAADPPAGLVLGVADLFAGGRLAGALWLAGLCVAWVWMLRVRRDPALLLLALGLGPILLFAWLRPNESAYAYARYLLGALPFLLMLLGWLVVEAVGRALEHRVRADAVAVGLGAALVAPAGWWGPLGRDHVDDGPYRNRYHSFAGAPERMNSPFGATPAIYAHLAAIRGPVRIIESPPILQRNLMLYRNYYRQHRKETLLGTISLGQLLDGPYVAILDPVAIEQSGADYLILHRDVEAELERSLESRRQRGPGVSRAEIARVEQQLTARYGPAGPLDDDVAVWKLR
ncbi:MAG: hypothetical protein V3U03_12395 [Myxococcota bacterium]